MFSTDITLYKTTIKEDCVMVSSGVSVGYFVFALILIILLYSFIKFRDATKKFFKMPIGRFSIVGFFSYFILTFLTGPGTFFAPIAHLGRDDAITVIFVSVCAGISYLAIIRLVREAKKKNFDLVLGTLSFAFPVVGIILCIVNRSKKETNLPASNAYLLLSIMPFLLFALISGVLRFIRLL
jgi:hypothetical protein